MLMKAMNLDNFIDSQKPITEISSNRLVVSNHKTKLIDVLNIMLTKKFRKIPIVDEYGNLKGIVSSTDLLDLFGGGEKHELFKKKGGSLDIRVENFMTKHVKTIHYKTSIRKALEIFKSERSGLYPIVDSKRVISVVSEWDFTKLINEPVGMKVREVMVEKPFFVRKGYNVYDVAKMICRGGARRLPVVENNILLGVVTPTDILIHLRKKGNHRNFFLDKTRIESIMKKELFTIDADSDLFSAVSLMKSMNVGGLPVVDEEELVGIITERDVVDAFI